MAFFGSLWVGRPLSKLENTSLSSFIHHGHSFVLYVYDLNLLVPEGVTKKDAREVMPEESIFVVDNSYGPFSDLFRYKMIQDTGLIWTDTDNICLKSDWSFSEYIFGIEEAASNRVANSLLFAPKDSPLLLDLIEQSQSFDRKLITWSEIGPQLLTDLIKKHGLQDYAMPPNVFYPVHFSAWKSLWQEERFSTVKEYIKYSYTLQVWNQMRNREGIDPNHFPEGSALDYFYNLYYKKENP
jgi:hypothetical protein